MILISVKEILAFEKKIASSLVEDNDLAMAYVNFANELAKEKKMDPTGPAFIALHMFQSKNDSSGIVQACMVITNHLFNDGQYEHALNYLKLAEEQVAGDEKSPLLAYVLNKIGFVYFQLKKFDDAIVAFGNCVDMLENLGDSGSLNELPKIYCTLGFIYQELKQSERANEMFQKSVSVARMAGNEAEARKYESFIL